MDLLRQRKLENVAMTAHSSLEDRQRCEQSGMNDYIAKPFKIDALQEVLSHWKLL